MKKLLTGNEAIARGAYEAGVRFASAYPGTPSTEILENLSAYGEIHSEWAPNEKVALEGAIGASFAGARAIASMKHVGVNVAADALMTHAYVGVDGGLVLVTADEPGQHSSQNEQDNRNYAKFAKIPMLEPSDSQESKDMVRDALEISERYDTPVLFRTTTRICHSKSVVECGERREVPIRDYVKNIPKRMTVPFYARAMRVRVEERAKKLSSFSEETPLNYVVDNDSETGVIASGACCRYAREVFGSGASYLKLGFTWPLPEKKIRDFAGRVKKIYVIEENDPYIEEAVKLLGIPCIGKDTFPYNGEMTPDVIRRCLGSLAPQREKPDMSMVLPRPPMFCAGCPHRGFFYELGKRKNLFVAGDIGCYALAFDLPFETVDFNLCMGSGVSCGHGAQLVFDMKPDNKTRVVSIIGDSTFFHTGINSLINVLYNNSPTVNVIMDNRITGMTGHQENPGSGFTAMGEPGAAINIENVARALGFKNVSVINPNDLAEVSRTLDWALGLQGPSVIITRWPCALKKLSDADRQEFNNAFAGKYEVDEGVCVGCKMCLRAGCPAIQFDAGKKKSRIGSADCMGCGVCAQICPKKAIERKNDAGKVA
ncbi:MAG: indolepyruvate ferredoxin oxidoreductase subunit alpha [Synergistaceae bacterium]|jgi:indolepyruvate ferredoxin oxidoreductase alpha subunit|nr:indolepyruvate ferredoxin oxidoreductase subunit alpha [Synergistaceae bacterium]